MSEIVNVLEATNKSYPVIDETGFEGLIGNLELKGRTSDFESLDKAFQKYKIRLLLEDRVVDVLVISEPEFVN